MPRLALAFTCPFATLFFTEEAFGDGSVGTWQSRSCL
jgi:hypothetical protein